jgi:predicted  nucleic acid-binding Zn-ribbon protein
MTTTSQVDLLLELHRLESGCKGSNGADSEKLVTHLDPSLRRRYRNLKERKGSGVAVMRDSQCSACRMIYPATHAMLRYKNSVTCCEFCGRILVVSDKS